MKPIHIILIGAGLIVVMIAYKQISNKKAQAGKNSGAIAPLAAAPVKAIKQTEEELLAAGYDPSEIEAILKSNQYAAGHSF